MVLSHSSNLRKLVVAKQGLAEQIRELIAPKFDEAKRLNAIWREQLTDSTHISFTLFGAFDAVQVVIDENKTIQLVFSNRTKPAFNLDIFPDNSITAYFASLGSAPSVAKYLGLIHQLAIGPVERTVYGWADNNQCSTLVLPGATTYQGGINYPPGLACYVLEDTALPQALKLPKKVSDVAIVAWCRRFWTATTEQQLGRIGIRIQQLPREAWSVGDGRLNYIWFTEADGIMPELVPHTPYAFQDPREDFPGQFTRTSWGEYQQDLRAWVRP